MKNLNVILLKNDKTHKIGAIVKVKPGYARNFLFPQKRALPVSLIDEKLLRHQKKIAEKKRISAEAESKLLSTNLKGLSLTISAKTTIKGKLFGSITSNEISKLLNKKGYKIDPNNILTNTIKNIGCHNISICLPPDTNLKLKLNVVSEDI